MYNRTILVLRGVSLEIPTGQFVALLGDFGWVGAYGTQFWVDPQAQLFAVMMIQTTTPATRAQYWTLMRDLVYQAHID